jgi:PleD family two-component response regulator
MQKHILIIDNDTQELRKLREILTREGYDIMTATDKQTAIQISEKVPIGFILAKASMLGFPNEKQ